MSRFTFFLGLANLILSAFLLGACTESFWLVYALQALFIIGLRMRHSWAISKGTPTQPGMLLYYLVAFSRRSARAATRSTCG